MELPHLTNDNYAAFIAENQKLVIDYFADWCGPCQMMGPIFQEVADKFATERPDITFAKVNIDEARTAADEANVMSIPTMVIYKGGEEFDRNIGGMSAQDLTNFILENFPAE